MAAPSAAPTDDEGASAAVAVAVNAAPNSAPAAMPTPPPPPPPPPSPAASRGAAGCNGGGDGDGGGAAVRARLAALEKAAERLQCPLCFDAQRDAVLPCGHAHCAACTSQLARCPECSVLFVKTAVRKLYLT